MVCYDVKSVQKKTIERFIMEYYMDISTELFEKIKEHETEELLFKEEELNVLTKKNEFPYFEQGDTLKLYHPGEDPEAFRLEITGEKIKNGQISLSFERLEWMMALETTADAFLKEEKELREEYGIIE